MTSEDLKQLLMDDDGNLDIGSRIVIQATKDFNDALNRI